MDKGVATILAPRCPLFNPTPHRCLERPLREGRMRGQLPSRLLAGFCATPPAGAFPSQARCEAARTAGSRWGSSILFLRGFF